MIEHHIKSTNYVNISCCQHFTEPFYLCEGKYDGSGKTPKLLCCSHTVCLECLQQISNDENLEDKYLNCPICRERILIPTQGVSAIPPAFLVNQLLELMRKQKRELVSRCNSHPDQELAYCETCDEVFCASCKGWCSDLYI